MFLFAPGPDWPGRYRFPVLSAPTHGNFKTAAIIQQIFVPAPVESGATWLSLDRFTHFSTIYSKIDNGSQIYLMKADKNTNFLTVMH